MELRYYSKRLDELEKRKSELQSKLVTAKLSLKGIDKEIKACKEAINNQTQVVRTDADRKDEKILSLTKQLDGAKNSISKLKLENTQLKHELQTATGEVNSLKQDVYYLELKNDNLNQQIKKLKTDLANLKNKKEEVVFSQDIGDENIFYQIMRGLDENEYF